MATESVEGLIPHNWLESNSTPHDIFMTVNYQDHNVMRWQKNKLMTWAKTWKDQYHRATPVVLRYSFFYLFISMKVFIHMPKQKESDTKSRLKWDFSSCSKIVHAHWALSLLEMHQAPCNDSSLGRWIPGDWSNNLDHPDPARPGKGNYVILLAWR